MKSLTHQRLDALDGLRAVAALGVLWIHSWTAHGNPRFIVGPIDFTSILALGGNGVDLFFVISGFCMYFFYADRPKFSYGDYWKFIKRRWIRLSPAFYTITVVYVLYRYSESSSTALIVPKVLTSVLYLNSISPYNAEGFFWSLSTEWQFYMVVPFLLIHQKSIGFNRSFFITSSIMLVLAVVSVCMLKTKSDIITLQIVFRYFEFATGILVGRLILIKKFNVISFRPLWLLFFILLSYTGRTLLSSYMLNFSSSYYNLFKIVGFTLMCIGFSGILYLALSSKKWLRYILGNSLMSFLGRISYSFYLWHGLMIVLISKYLVLNLNDKGILAPLATFTLCIIVLIPISYISYLVLEKPFMKIKRKDTSAHIAIESTVEPENSAYK